MRIFILLVLITGIAGCSVLRSGAGRLGIGSGSARKANVEVDGTRYRARAIASKADRRDITVTVTPVATNPEAALDAARYQATRYCLLTYGGSDTVWTVGPDQSLAQLPVVNDSVTLQGRCTQR